MCRSKHVEPSINFGIINSITKLHLVGISTEFFQVVVVIHFVYNSALVWHRVVVHSFRCNGDFYLCMLKKCLLFEFSGFSSVAISLIHLILYELR